MSSSDISRERADRPTKVSHQPDQSANAPLSGAGPKVEQLLYLQRTAGNAAVGRLLRRQVQRAPPPATVNPETARVAKLTDDYNKAVAKPDWPEAANLLNAFNNDDIPKKLGSLNHEQRIQLHAGSFQSMPPPADRIRDHIGKLDAEAARVGKLLFDYNTAVAKPDWLQAATLLNAFNDLDIVPMLRQLSPAQRLAMDAVAKGAVDRVHRFISFIANAPGPASPATTTTVSDAGTLASTNKVDGGEVNVRTGAKYDSYTDGYSVEYKGKDSENSRWLQFIWREIVVTDPVKGVFRVNQAITTTGGSYNLTTDPAKPSYNTDTASTTSPFYEAGGTANRTADSTTMFDHPASADAIVQAQFAGGATSVVSRAHFNTYLVRDAGVLDRVSVDVEWKYTSATVPPRVNSVPSNVSVGTLDPGMRARLIAQFPKFDYIP
jgi:hypothetical protein